MAAPPPIHTMTVKTPPAPLTPEASFLRRLLTFALLGSAPVMCAFAIWLIIIVAYGDWKVDRQEQQIAALAIALFMFIGGILFVIAAIAIGGPIKAVRGGAGPVNFELNSQDHPPPPPTVTTTTETKVEGGE